MDPTAQYNPSDSSNADDMVLKLQKQLDTLKQQKSHEETETIKQYQQAAVIEADSDSVDVDNISAEDILNAFRSGGSSDNLPAAPQSSNPTNGELPADEQPTESTDYPAINRITSISDQLVQQMYTANGINSTLTSSGIGTSLPTGMDESLAGNPLQVSQPPQHPQPVGSAHKETLVSSGGTEQAPYQEVGAELSKDEELEKWVEEVPDPKTITLPKPVEDDYGQILVQASQIPKPNIVLPLTETEMAQGQDQSLVNSIRWLYEWAKRLIMLQPGRVFYKQNKNN